MDERLLREYFLPTFEEAIKNNAATLMVNSGEINGIPVHASKEILTDLLRNELGFKGLVVTDWEDIMKLHNIHKVAPTMKDAVRMAVEAGIDMSMVPNDFVFSDLLLELVEEGTIPEARLDESVRRILKLKIDLGLFDNPYPPNIDSFNKFNSDEHKEAAITMAAESITLLKNDGILPLKPSANIFLTGPGADNINFQNGAWTRTWQGVDTTWNDSTILSIAHYFRLEHGDQINYFNPIGATENEALATDAELAKAKQLATNSDIIVVCLAEFPSTEKVGDIDRLSLPQAQREYVKALEKTGKPIVLVLGFNRPRIISDIEPLADAVLMLYQPGDYGAVALEKIMFGEINPSGKLPFTWPREEASLLWYDHKHTERLDQKFGMTAFNPQWEFGYGLSYSTFVYENMKINRDTMSFADTIQISVDIANVSSIEGKEVVQCYFSDRYASITPSVKLLKAFSKETIEAQKTKETAFSIPVSDLAFLSKDMTKVVEEGWFDVQIGSLVDSLYIKK
jgi:beta-glucosidase